MTDDRLVAIDPGASIDRVIARAIAAGEALRAADDDRVVRAIARAAATLRDGGSRIGHELRELVPMRSGLHLANVERALATTLCELEEAPLRGALEAVRAAHAGVRLPSLRTAPVRVAAMVLAGNVFTAAMRPLAWALLLRTPVVIKPSTEDEGLSELFAVALAEADPELGEALALLRFARQDEAMLSALASRCDVLHAWGSDRTMTAIRGALPATTTFVPHGHGLGLAFVDRDARELAPIADAIANDVALYDQRGCLSPHAVLVERGGAEGAELARAIERSLAAIERTMPRGPLPLPIAAAQMQWRGVAGARGELLEGSTWAVSFEGNEAPRVSPGYRNVGVYEVAGRQELAARLAPFGAHLKALGVTGDPEARRTIAALLPAGVAPRISALGAMQIPPLAASADGEPPWSGLIRRVDLD